VKLFSHWLR